MPSMGTGEYLFVYGTLRRDVGHRMHDVLLSDAEFAGYARFRGSLFRVDDYAGVTASDRPDDLVLGEIYELRDNSLLDSLDEFEECGSGFPKPTDFVRRRVEVKMQDGSTNNAWIYLYNLSTDNLESIPSGDFAEGKGERFESSGPDLL